MTLRDFIKNISQKIACLRFYKECKNQSIREEFLLGLQLYAEQTV